MVLFHLSMKQCVDAAHMCMTPLFPYHHGNSQYTSIPNRPERLCGELWSKLGGSRSGVYGGRGVSSTIFFLLESSLFLGQACLYSVPSLLCLQDLGQREIAETMRRVQEGILSLLWFAINVFIRQAPGV